MEWHTLLSLKRLGETRAKTVGEEEGRSEFQRDFDRIVFSTAFRRFSNFLSIAVMSFFNAVNSLLIVILYFLSV